MQIKSANFVGSFTEVAKLPVLDIPEYAFIGRSNVGKSSLINMVCQREGLAMVSGTPGKTKAINFFRINEHQNKGWHLVDLPGYGYAKLPKSLREEWQEMTRHYFCERPQLQCVFLLVDSCIEPQELDLEFADQLGEWQVPFVIVFTKVDRKKARENLKGGFMSAFEAEFLKSWEAMPQMIMSSAEKGQGRDEICQMIALTNEQFHNSIG